MTQAAPAPARIIAPAGPDPDRPACRVVDWGRVGYDEGVERMERLADARKSDDAPDTLVFCSHDPVVTLGRTSHAENLLLPEAELERRGIAVRESGRGGDVTYHGPGQLVGYPVIRLEGSRRDAHRYLRDLEEVLIRALGDLGVRAFRREGLTGVWTERGKVAAIGVRLSRWVTSHGFALNLRSDPAGFACIVPCGLGGERVTSVEEVLARAVPFDEAAVRIAGRFGEVFGRTMSAARAPHGEAA